MAAAHRRSAMLSRGARLIVALVTTVALARAPAVTAESAAATGAELDKPLDAKLQRPEGGRLRLGELRGQPLLLDLWATWCLPCQEQSRILHALDDELADRNVAVLSVNQGESPQVVLDFVADHPSDFPAALDRGQIVSRLLDVGELPALALLDAEGKVVGVRLGLTQKPDVLELLSALDDK